MNNKIIIAAAGSGKTTFLVNQALRIKDGTVLITTYTQANELEIRKKIIEINRCIPGNIIIQTWFSFLLQHGVRPYQGYITDKKIRGLVLVNTKSAVKYVTRRGIPVCYSEEEDVEKYYFTADYKIYSDKVSKFVYRCDTKSEGAVIKRLSKIYSHIFIDEVQDLAGFDLMLIKLLLQSASIVLMVGDPRQVTYLTHNERKYSKYIDGKIKEFIQVECRGIQCEIDESTLNKTYRNNTDICDFSSRLYPQYKPCKSEQHETTGHDGLFFIKNKDVDQYLSKYKPLQLRYDSKTKVNDNYQVMNYGEAKGLTFDRVIIYPTKPILAWLINNDKELPSTSKSKFYVALTRAKYSAGIVYDYNDKTEVAGISKYI